MHETRLITSGSLTADITKVICPCAKPIQCSRLDLRVNRWGKIREPVLWIELLPVSYMSIIHTIARIYHPAKSQYL
jgi:hypothetical protein